MYKIEIAPQAKKQLKDLKIRHKLSLLSIIEDLKDNLFAGKALTRDFSGKYSYRVGVYRIIYRINVKTKLVEIISAGHRSIVYN
ncbi:MAG: Addiction module toxin RelE [Microgenomates group bacterium GW2011_GWC1_39_7b]|uniref:Addiction module toxin RelE n=3 Tax=Candidatus Woeseibacteriota TaxID=1752722 RepID=A0A0G0LME7_9BACT|nr:MAG: Addiction module toxin RelE [Candidatus Woesebacteria bacterium GW2011_GWB1_39_10]KKR26929.1 MAG: Addiction module toxin RelE [Microgenomates group bacterium GW2011_GWC1_39_7b]KKR72943.1 MAG: Addiction module toxin RelE [Candidatus Woesebacteria bacterium GW2011_GWA2_40_7]KKS91172.1 MAG: Addiction module toxin RelE [Candidatus Woesebacteria bacterium GW2011_GWA1_43_12]